MNVMHAESFSAFFICPMLSIIFPYFEHSKNQHHDQAVVPYKKD